MTHTCLASVGLTHDRVLYLFTVTKGCEQGTVGLDFNAYLFVETVVLV